MNPEPTNSQEISASVTSLMKSSSSLLEGAEVKRENGKTIIKPKKKITLKEFLASQPYKFIVDNSIAQPKSAPCNYRWSYYYTLERFSKKEGNILGMFFTNMTVTPSWADMQTYYGFSQIMVTPEDYLNTKLLGWGDSSIIVRLPWNPLDSLTAIQSITNHPYVLGFYIDEPLERNKCTIAEEQAYIIKIAKLVSPKPLMMGSYWLGWTLIMCSGNSFYQNFTDHYNYIFGNTNNTFIMCDQYQFDGSNLQSLWENYKSSYGNRNNANFMDFICQNPDGPVWYGHWDGLFPCAKNSCNLNSIYLFSDFSASSEDILHSFCYYAWNNNYIRGYGKHVTITERCSSPNCEHCQDPEDPEGEQYWYIESIVTGDTWYERYP